MDQPNYYAIIPSEIRYSKKLTLLQKLLYAEITALSNKEGYCWASNKYFADLYGKTETWISMTINNMKDLGFLDILLEKEGFHTKRTIIIVNKPTLTTTRKLEGRGSIKLEHNNTRVITSIEKKEDFLNVLDEETISLYKPQLQCIWYMIELGYKLEMDRDCVIKDIDWLKDKADIYGYRMVDGGYDWNSIKQRFDRRYTYHKDKGNIVERHKSSILQFLDPNSDKKGKQKK